MVKCEGFVRMRVIPVLDLKDGRIVRGVAGRRDEYRPIFSRLTYSSYPIDVARAFREHFGLTELYLADLDAIAGAPPAFGVYAGLRAEGFRLWIDAGVRDERLACCLAEAGVDRVVVGLETIPSPEVLAAICRGLGRDRVVFSLDLKGGEPLGEATAWGDRDCFSIAAQAITAGAGAVLVLDLSRVGTGGGVGTEDLCRRLSLSYPELELIAGGGVRDVADVRRLGACGVSAVLVATALHDGRLTAADLASISAD